MNSAIELLRRAQQLLDQRRFGAAESLARQVLADMPEDARFWQLAGMACWAQQHCERARGDLETASALAPLWPLSWIALADCYLRLDQVEAARGIYVMLADNERFPTTLLAKLATGLGRVEEHRLALRICRRLARRQPDHHGAFFGMAYYLSRLDYPRRSCLARLRQAYRLAPDLLLYRVNLASAYAELGRMRTAYHLVRQLDPESIPCACWLRRLAWICEAAHDTPLSQRFAAALLRRSPASP